MAPGYIMAIDQGTTGSTVLIIDHDGKIVSRGYSEFTQIFPQPGWVEHDPLEIWGVTVGTATQAMMKADIKSDEIMAIGITNQRETTVVWEKSTGRPVANAIVWQCRRTAPLCNELKASGWESRIRERTGLVLDAYFSGTKLAWLLENVPDARSKAANGDLLFGTIDSWLVWKLTGGKVHITDYSNASRTMMFDIHQLQWDQEILDLLRIPGAILPEVRESSQIYGYSDPEIFGTSIPVAAVAGDQQAALFGQACFTPGAVKNTYGTGCFMLMNTGDRAYASQHGLLTTIAWRVGDEVVYALEGSIFMGGAAVQWLRDEMKIIEKASDSEQMANAVPDNGGVYVVPAFVGLGAPYWDMYARGSILGMTRGTSREHVVRATLESIAFQTHDVLEAMSRDTGIMLETLKVDGGAVSNDFLMQFQADILNVNVERPVLQESTAMGAAMLAGLAVGYWKDMTELEHIRKVDQQFVPSMPDQNREKLLKGWRRAVEAVLFYSRNEQRS